MTRVKKYTHGIQPAPWYNPQASIFCAKKYMWLNSRKYGYTGIV